MLRINDTIWSTLDSYWCTACGAIDCWNCEHVQGAQRPANSESGHLGSGWALCAEIYSPGFNSSTVLQTIILYKGLIFYRTEYITQNWYNFIRVLSPQISDSILMLIVHHYCV